MDQYMEAKKNIIHKIPTFGKIDSVKIRFGLGMLNY